ncbi:LamG-like jellyroll fold domain-containing protein [Polaribacter pectinis]|uniref:LamG-like jellyroll fold domain-containing protein n=1 Tax=Polaribacter pectinis TaxID=2738844 RepID=UPI00349E8C0A
MTKRDGANYPDIQSSFPLTLGALANDYPVAKFNGAMDDFQIFNRVLTDSEIKALSKERE